MENSVAAAALLIFIAGLPIVTALTGTIVNHIFPSAESTVEVRQKSDAA